MEATAILQPMFVVALLTVTMTLWMYFTRIPAMKKLRIHPQKAQDVGNLRELLPPETMRISDNYNHLFEQPTLFYAVVIAIAILGHVDPLHLACAWAYAIFRIGHSLVQATVNIVMIRFGLFVLSWIVLGTMIVREAIALFI